MKFADIITLAKAGYSPKDIKELLELTETDPKTKETPVPDPEKKEPEKKEPEKKEPELDAFEKLVNKEKEGT